MGDSPALLLIPSFLGDQASLDSLSIDIANAVSKTDYYIVENEKSARRFIKRICPNKVQSLLHIRVINKHSSEDEDWKSYLRHIIESGHCVGVISEAGCPSIADPGASIVREAHTLNIRVIPLVGPSSILLSLMASGMNGQSFQFHGYLPIDKFSRINKILHLEKLAIQNSQTQIFIETPYRNHKLLDDLIKILKKNTMLCLCTDLTLSSEIIISKPVKYWSSTAYNFHKKPTIFLIGNS